MLRSRRSTITTIGGGAASEDYRHDEQPSKKMNQPVVVAWRKIRRMATKRRLRLAAVGYIVCSMMRFYLLMSKNMQPPPFPSIRNNITAAANLRGGGTAIILQSDDTCPALPERLQHGGHLPPLAPLTKRLVEKQLKFIKETTPGTTGNRILTCPPLHKHCRGVTKVYRSKAVYHHVKRCLTLLQDAGIGARILYADDETATMVEEDMGRVTMLNSEIPDDFDVQLWRIRCLLRHHQILHRDLTWQNIIVNQFTGKLYVIDFGDAFVWQGFSWQERLWRHWENYSRRNVENLFNIWWKHYDEDGQLERLISETRPEVKGDRLWKPPSTTYQRSSIAQHRAEAAMLFNQVLWNGGGGGK
jgi:hypothetical protein